MTQQTIGNTVYTVGQVLRLDRLPTKLPQGTALEVLAVRGEIPHVIYEVKITALPNPDPVADEWREVVHPDKRAGGYPEAMQEVCKAERVWHMWPDFTEWGGNKPLPTDDGMVVRDFGLIAETVDITIRCFLLGGKVSVKGGV